MRKLILMAGLVIAASSPAWAAIVRHAGEWQTVIDNGQPLLACFSSDATLDQAYVNRLMAKLPGANCRVGNISTLLNVTSYSMQCTVGGSPMTSSGTITQTGPDAFISKVHSHGGMMKMPNGQTMVFPDTDTVTVQHRLGACKPGDHMIDD